MAVIVLSDAIAASWLPPYAMEFVLGEALQTSFTVAAGACHARCIEAVVLSGNIAITNHVHACVAITILDGWVGIRVTSNHEAQQLAAVVCVGPSCCCGCWCSITWGTTW